MPDEVFAVVTHSLESVPSSATITELVHVCISIFNSVMKKDNLQQSGSVGARIL